MPPQTFTLDSMIITGMSLRRSDPSAPVVLNVQYALMTSSRQFATTKAVDLSPNPTQQNQLNALWNAAATAAANLEGATIL